MEARKTWFVSDLHFFHKNILNFCPLSRHGETVQEMNEYIISAWNRRIRKRDIVYNLGDVSFGKVKDTMGVLSRLNGEIHLIFGNHDKPIRQNKELSGVFASVQDVKEIKVTLSDGTKRDVFLSHFPHRTWNKAGYGAWHLFGHVHGDMADPWGRSMDVGIDARPLGDMCPWSLEEVEAILEQREAIHHHGD